MAGPAHCVKDQKVESHSQNQASARKHMKHLTACVFQGVFNLSPIQSSSCIYDVASRGSCFVHHQCGSTRLSPVACKVRLEPGKAFETSMLTAGAQTFPEQVSSARSLLAPYRCPSCSTDPATDPPDHLQLAEAPHTAWPLFGRRASWTVKARCSVCGATKSATFRLKVIERPETFKVLIKGT